MRIIMVVAILSSAILATAQSDSLLIQNSKPIDNNRYVGIDGSPYYFSDWVIGSILRNDGQTVEDVLMNYNGHVHELEVRLGDKVHTLDKRWHLRADVSKEKNPALSEEFPVDRLIFQRGAQNQFMDRYSTILYLGEKYTLIRDCDIGKIEKEFNDVGRTYTVERFKDLSLYFLKSKSGIVQLKLQKKKIAEAFGDNPAIEAFIEKEKLDLGEERDLVRLVQFAEGL
jgi:hypothetical protein